MLHLVHYESRPARVAPYHALGLLEHAELELPDVAGCEIALRSLCDRGLAAIVDTSVQKQICKFLATLDCVGPTDGMPCIGAFDLTLAGAALWREILNFSHSEFESDAFWHNTLSFVYRRGATILIGYDLTWVLEEVRRCEFTAMDPPERIGAWRSQWWREIPSGYRQRCEPLCD